MLATSMWPASRVTKPLFERGHPNWSVSTIVSLHGFMVKFDLFSKADVYSIVQERCLIFTKNIVHYFMVNF